MIVAWPWHVGVVSVQSHDIPLEHLGAVTGWLAGLDKPRRDELVALLVAKEEAGPTGQAPPGAAFWAYVAVTRFCRENGWRAEWSDTTPSRVLGVA